jgi:general secretion pathway protein J
MKRARGDRRDGFALIESVAVLALSALVLLTLLIAAGLVTRNAGAASRRTHEVESLATAFAAIRRDLAAAMFVRTEPDPESPLLFEGGAGSIGFAVERDAPDLGYSASLIRIEARYENGRGMLTRSSARLYPDVSSLAGAAYGDEAVLMNGPWSYRFAYANAASGALQWSETWTNTAALPAAIRLEVMDASGAMIVPPFVARLGVDAELNCAESDFGCPDEESELFQEEEGIDESQGEQ